MAQYKCTNSFTSSNGKRFNYGEKISSYDFTALPYNEQRNFTRYEEENYCSSNDNGSYFISPSSFDFGSSSTDSNSSSDFNGFGGGDSGGGGSSSDW